MTPAGYSVTEADARPAAVDLSYDGIVIGVVSCIRVVFASIQGANHVSIIYSPVPIVNL